MPPVIPARLRQLLTLLSGLWAAGFMLVFAWLVYQRLNYPYELECMDGGTLQVIRRLVAGLPLYARPSLDYAPYIYQPIYFYCAKVLTHLVGVGFPAMRLVSIIATVLTTVLIGRWIWRETASAWAALVAAGFFLACYPIGVAIMDLAKVDPLFVLWLGLCAYHLRFAECRARAAMGGCLLVLAFFTKQTALIAMPPLLLIALSRGWRIFIPFVAPLLLVPPIMYALQRHFDGWYLFYTFTLLRHRAIAPEVLAYFWTREFALPFGLALALMLIAGYLLLRRRAWRPVIFYGLFIGGMTLLAFGGRLNRGGEANVLLPMLFALALGFGFALGELLRHLPSLPERDRPWAACLPATLVLLQLAALTFDPRQFVPTPADRHANEALVNLLRTFPGEVMIPYHGYLAVMAGKQSFAYGMAVFELTGAFGKPHPLGEEIMSQYRRDVAAARFDAIVLNDAGTYLGLKPEDYLRAGYRKIEPVIENKNAMFPVTGWHTRPEVLWVRGTRAGDGATTGPLLAPVPAAVQN